MDKKDIFKLAKLARLEITDAEAESYQKDFDGILAYIDSIKGVDVDMKGVYETNLTKNYMREDTEVYTAGQFTNDLLEAAPERDANYFKVKKVL